MFIVMLFKCCYFCENPSKFTRKSLLQHQWFLFFVYVQPFFSNKKADRLQNKYTYVVLVMNEVLYMDVVYKVRGFSRCIYVLPLWFYRKAYI